ncbi:MAG: Unknown protein [uncultured Thiotrichaceae bacterium]|uniref:DUF349 domain-containing protein n=1 Tax=uncultured Thiotrichaceae bacterium TaxID=298394 RepID=A0A6S6TE95_9GAMM|nr:MAG: Unknown protein [uncultured Thiotrichaceae bacterium]
MLGGLFKPKWQHSNARIRMQALSSLGSDSAELIQLVQSDPNTGVRLEAIAYLTDLPVLLQLGKRTDSIGERARLRLLGLVAHDNSQDAMLVEVFDWLMANPTLVETIARDAQRAPVLRQLAIEQLDDENLLFKIASEDVSRELQYLAASRLQDQDKLKQLEKTQGRNNKKLRLLLKERMTAFQQKEALHQALESMAVDLEALGLSGHWAQEKTQHRVLVQSWQKTVAEAADTDIPAVLDKRFRDAETVFLGRLGKYEKQQAELEPLRAVFLAYLQDAEVLQQTLNERPEELTLSMLDQKLEQWQERWVSAEPLPDEEQQEALNQRWMAAYVALVDKRDTAANDLGAVDSLRRCCSRAESMRKGKRPLQAKQLTALQSEWVQIKRPGLASDVITELESRFHQSMDSLNARLQREAEEREEKLRQMKAELDQMEADLEQEKYGEAIDLHRNISMRLKELGSLDEQSKRGIEQRLRAAAPMVMEFKDWRRWGTDQAREHLIETAQRLENDDSMEPEQRAKEIKALREEWRKLAQMEPGQQRKQWKDFDQKVTAAYEPSKQHFAEQAKQRNEHLQQREAICAQLETMKTETDWSTVDWKAQYAVINERRKDWKKCGTVGHKDWKSVNQRFNDAMDGLEEHLKAERERNFKERQRLMERSVALAEMDDVQAAVSEAKSLQADWQITIPSRPREEQKLWKQFRGPIDAVFARLKDDRQSQRSETDERIQQKDAVCAKLEGLLQLSDEEFIPAARELGELRSAFDGLRDIPRAVLRQLEERFSSAEQAVLNKQEQLRRTIRLAKLDVLAARSAEIKGAGSVVSDDATQIEGETLCLQMEILLDIDTPAAFQQARMEYQIAQMRDAMCSPNERQDIREQGLELLAGWYKLGAMPAEALAQQQARIDVVRQAIAK